MRWVRRLLLLGAIGAVLVGGWRFAAGNQARVAVDLLFASTAELALWQALMGAFALGAAVVGLLCVYDGLRQRLLNRRYRKAVSGLESEIHQLRNLPLAPEEPAPGASLEADLPAPPRGVLGRSAGA